MIKMLLVNGLVISFQLLQSCSSSKSEAPSTINETQKVETVFLKQDTATLYKSYPTTIEGINNVEIRPQISGYVEKIYVNEGQYVKAGTVLFKINAQPYVEQKNQALAALQVAKSQLATAQLELYKYQDLSALQVSSDFQYKKAKTAFYAAQSQVKMQEAIVSSAQVNLNFAILKSPINGHVGRIPRKIGALVSPSDAEPITRISDNEKIYAYFAMNENDVLTINDQVEGNNIVEKLQKHSALQLQLSNGSTHPYAGVIDMVDGQYNTQTASLTLRATFKNPDHLLRTGNTAKVVLQSIQHQAFKIPILATYELQDMIVVGKINAKNEVEYIPLNNPQKSGEFYIVTSGFQNDDQIVARELSLVPENSVVDIKK